jgi:hypothetical protein
MGFPKTQHLGKTTSGDEPKIGRLVSMRFSGKNCGATSENWEEAKLGQPTNVA